MIPMMAGPPYAVAPSFSRLAAMSFQCSLNVACCTDPSLASSRCDLVHQGSHPRGYRVPRTAEVLADSGHVIPALDRESLGSIDLAAKCDHQRGALQI